MLVPDFMHKFKLGVWKATLTHLIRILLEVGNNVIQEFNVRYVFSCHWPDDVLTMSVSGQYWHLAKTLYANLVRMYQISQNLQQGTLRTSSRYVIVIWLWHSNPATVLKSVCYTCFWWSASQAPQFHHPQPFIWAGYLAHVRKASHAHWNNAIQLPE